MDLIDALRTTGAVREFTGVPVDDATLYRILDTARFAPNGGNRQAWRVVVVQDPPSVGRCATATCPAGTSTWPRWPQV